jgi:hypothetical protein
MPMRTGFLPYEPRHRERCLALFDENCPDSFAIF